MTKTRRKNKEKDKNNNQEERYTLIISILALLISIFTFSWGEIKDSRVKRQEQNRIMYLSYMLGYDYGSLTSLKALSEMFDSIDITDFEYIALTAVKGEMNDLQLSIPLSEKKFSSYGYSALGDRIYLLIGNKYGNNAADAHQLGKYLGQISTTVQVGLYKTDSEEMKTKFFGDFDTVEYYNILNEANSLLQKLGINGQIDVSKPLSENTLTEMTNIDLLIKSQWQYDVNNK